MGSPRNRAVVAGVVLVGTVAAGCRLADDPGNSGVPGAAGAAGAPGDRGSTTSTVVVAKVIDGDTVETASGRRVRLIGVDTPEHGTCGFEAALQAMRRMVEGREVKLVNPDEVQDRDVYDRLLRFVDRGGRDAGLAQIRAGLAEARYDSTDGYDHHPRERRYHAADRARDHDCEGG